MIRRAALLAVALVSVGCVRDSDEQPVARHLVYTKPHGLPTEAVWIGDVDGRGMRKLVRGYAPLVAPDGSKIAFHRCLVAHEECLVGDAEPALYTIQPSGGEPQLVTRNASADGWFPDSRSLLSVGDDLVKIDAESGDRTVLARDVGYTYGWSISPDGEQVLYARSLKENRWGICRSVVDVFVADVDGKSNRRLTWDGRSSDPVWGDGRIAFARHPVDPKCITPSAGIWTMRPDGRGARPIVRRAPARFAWNGYYGLRPHGWVRGRPLIVAGVLSEWGDELALVDTRSGRIRRPDLDPRPRYTASMAVDYLSEDGHHVLGIGCGAEYPCTIQIYSVLERKAQNVITGQVGSPHWNR